LAEKLRGFWALIKSRQTLLLLATGLAGYLSARPEGITGLTIALMLFGLSATISGTTALNMVIDRDIDARMARTAWRPLPSGTLTPLAAAIFGGGLVALGLGVAFLLSGVFGFVIAAGTFLDLVVYTLWLKRRSAWAIIFGGVSGGMPILAGRALVTGRVDGLGLLLALSVLLWIPTHIMTFSIKYAEDYRRAGVLPGLPFTAPIRRAALWPAPTGCGVSSWSLPGGCWTSAPTVWRCWPYPASSRWYSRCGRSSARPKRSITGYSNSPPSTCSVR
jgi:protoheme IX farnesyltransferase